MTHRATIHPVIAVLLSLALACGGGDQQPTEPDPQLTTIEVTPDSVELNALEATEDFDATATDQDGNEMSGVSVSWSVSPDSVAAIDGEGTATADANGTATLEAETSGVTGSAELTVDQEVDQVTISPSSIEINALGATADLEAKVADRNGNDVAGESASWSSLDADVATVDNSGKMVAETEGQVSITAAVNAFSDTAEVTVEQEADSVTVTPQSVTMDAGDEANLAATVKDARGNTMPDAEVTWSSSDPDVASVDQSGRVTGESEGTTTITAESGEASGEASVEVEPPPPSTGVRVTLETPTDPQAFALGIDGGDFGDDVRTFEAEAGGEGTTTTELSLPAGGPYRIRAVAMGERTGTLNLTQATGKATEISIAEGELVEVSISLDRYTVSISAPDTVSGGESVTVVWSYTEPGDALEDGSATQEPGGFLRHDTTSFSDSNGETEVASGQKLSEGEYEMEATFEAPLQPGEVYFQVEGFTFANIHNSGLEGPISSLLDPSTVRGDALEVIVVR